MSNLFWGPSEGTNRMGGNGSGAYVKRLYDDMHVKLLQERTDTTEAEVKSEPQALRVSKARKMFGGLLGSIDYERLDRETDTLG